MFSPINSQNTLFLKKAFWALLLPTTTASRVCDIWRGYWAQRLLWEVGGSLGFPGANARQPRNVQSYLSDALEETQMYFLTDRLLEFLTSWSCPQHLSSFACVENLSSDMVTEGFWGKEDAEITQIWLRDLMSAGYQETKLVKVGDNSDTASGDVTFFPVDQDAPSLTDLETDSVIPQLKRFGHVVKVCPRLIFDNSEFLRKAYKENDEFHDVLLIIVFNHPYYKTCTSWRLYIAQPSPTWRITGYRQANFEALHKLLVWM